MEAVPSLAILAGTGIALWLSLSATVRWLAKRAQAENATADEDRRAESARWADWRRRMDEAERASVQGMTYDELAAAAQHDPDIKFAALDALKMWGLDRDSAGETLEGATPASRASASRTVGYLRRAHPDRARSRDDEQISSIAAELQRERSRKDAERYSAQLVAEEQAAEKLGVTVEEYRHRLLVEHIAWGSASQRRR